MNMNITPVTMVEVTPPRGRGERFVTAFDMDMALGLYRPDEGYSLTTVSVCRNPRIETETTEKLERQLRCLEDQRNITDSLMDRIESELERRAYDESDPWAEQGDRS